MKTSLSLVVTALIAAPPAWADNAPAPQEESDWSFSVGLGAGLSPDYEGSDDYEASALPLVDITWRDIISVGTMNGIGLSVKAIDIQGPTPEDSLKFYVHLGYYGGRDEDSNDALKGLGDIDGNATAGVSMEYTIGAFAINAASETDISGDRDGTTLSAGVTYQGQLPFENTFFSVGPNVTWANDDYMQNTFGITASQAASSARGYQAFTAGSGIKDVGVGASLHHQYSPNVSLMGMVGYTQLVGDAADSPLVKNEGSDAQFSTMIGLVYSW